ncbi:hypothetical protein REPUB_Repub06bG0018400 [Reevesia pubescens]
MKIKKRTTSDYPSKKVKVKVNGSLRDQISELSDDILIDILSFLTLKDAARTSVLSQRWRHLWKFSSGSFDFDATKTMWDLKLTSDSRLKLKLKKERLRYVGWVNQVLNLHEGLTIDELRVRFDLDKRFEHYIDRWIDIALKKGVKNLELNLEPYNRHLKDDSSYVFPQEYFSASSRFKFLISLDFSYLVITDAMIENFLTSCPLLERLHVTHSPHLINIKVYGLSLRLKYFHLTYCHYVKSIEVFAPNLVTFDCEWINNPIELNIRYAPQLRNVGQTVEFDEDNITYDFVPLTNYLSQLVSLRLDIEILKVNKLIIIILYVFGF